LIGPSWFSATAEDNLPSSGWNHFPTSRSASV
jgi:hypothetical protein